MCNLPVMQHCYLLHAQPLRAVHLSEIVIEDGARQLHSRADCWGNGKAEHLPHPLQPLRVDSKRSGVVSSGDGSMLAQQPRLLIRHVVRCKTTVRTYGVWTRFTRCAQRAAQHMRLVALLFDRGSLGPQVYAWPTRCDTCHPWTDAIVREREGCSDNINAAPKQGHMHRTAA